MKNKVRFTSRSHPKSAIAATVLGVIAIILVAVMIYISAKANGAGGLIIGAGGVIAMIFCIIGAIMGIRSFLKEDAYYLFPIIATAINGGGLIALFVIYAMGVMA